MTAQRDPDRLIEAFLMEGQTELPDQIYDAVRASIEHKRQRVVIGPWRLPTMNKLVPAGFGAAAVVVALVAGTQLLSLGGGLGADPSVQPSPTVGPTPSSSIWSGIPKGPHIINGSNGPVQITVDITTPDWVPMSDFGAVGKNDDGLDAPESVGAVLLAWGWPSGSGIIVYGDACQWLTTIPETPATTPDEIAAAFAAQASSEATAPVDVTVGGYGGKALTLQVPMSFDLPNASREEKFADCDEATFRFYGTEGDAGDVSGSESRQAGRNAQGAGQIDELWILDVDGAIVIINASYSPATPAGLVDELRALAESATFE